MHLYVYTNFITNIFKKTMKNYKDLIRNFTKEDYREKRVNLHIHTAYSDGEADPVDIVHQAKAKNYSYIAISDHNTMKAYQDFDLTTEDIVIPSVEFDVWCGYVFMHLLAYGVDLSNVELAKFFAKSKRETELDIIRIFSRRNIKDLITAIHNAGGIAVLAHPACCWCLSLDKLVEKLVSYGLDGLEVYYPYARHRGIIKFHKAQTVEKIADKYGLIKTGGTDLHGKVL